MSFIQVQQVFNNENFYDYYQVQNFYEKPFDPDDFLIKTDEEVQPKLEPMVEHMIDTTNKDGIIKQIIQEKTDEKIQIIEAMLWNELNSKNPDRDKISKLCIFRKLIAFSKAFSVVINLPPNTIRFSPSFLTKR